MEHDTEVPLLQKLEQVVEDYKVPLLLGGASFFLVTLSILLLVKSAQTETPIQFLKEASVSGITTGTIAFDIEGAVAHPGVYTITAGSRVEDAIRQAGGLTDEADRQRIEKTINRAAKLSDGAKLYFPKTGEATIQNTLYDISKDQQSAASSNTSVSMISVNAASQQDLESLPGIGPVTATKIIRDRPYQSLEELVTKKIMGQSLFTKLKDRLSL